MSEPELLVVGLCGRARAGKDSVAKMLEACGQFHRIALADGVKSALNDLDGPTWDFRKERGVHMMTDRWAAQILGTECRNQIFDHYHWVNHLLIKICYAAEHHPVPRTRFVVPDIRYPHEQRVLSKWIATWGGRFECWRVTRPGEQIKESNHSSEQQTEEVICLRTIENNGTLAHLLEKVSGDYLPAFLNVDAARQAETEEELLDAAESVQIKETA